MNQAETAKHGTTQITAAVLVIGDEILSGRTADTNSGHVARVLTGMGIRLREVRVVGDVAPEIIAGLNALRHKYTYVFTTGGIGPTHDDITADAVAAAFGLEIQENSEALAMLARRYGAAPLNSARRRMARIPVGATLIENSVSDAPGFQVENVFVLAGVPRIMRAMLAALRPGLRTGNPLLTVTVAADIREGDVALALAAVQKAHGKVAIGSYPYFNDTGAGTQIVARSEDAEALQTAAQAIIEAVRAAGGQAHIMEPQADDMGEKT